MNNYGKVTQEMKEVMIEMREKGFTIRKISRILIVTQSTVQYHLNPAQRQKQIERSRKNLKKLTDEQKERKKNYQRNYQSRRYNNDEEFRDRVRTANRENKRRKTNGKSNNLS